MTRATRTTTTSISLDYEPRDAGLIFLRVFEEMMAGSALICLVPKSVVHSKKAERQTVLAASNLDKRGDGWSDCRRVGL